MTGIKLDLTIMSFIEVRYAPTNINADRNECFDSQTNKTHDH